MLRYLNYTGIGAVLLLIGAFIFPPTSQPYIPPLQQTIIVGGDYNFPPYEFLDANGNPTGYNVALIKAAGRVTGLTIKIQLSPWDEARQALETGKIDALMGMFFSETRAKTIDFSTPHTIVHHAIFVRKNYQKINTLVDLKNKAIIVQSGDIMHDYVLENNTSPTIILSQSPLEALQLLAAGNYDCALLAEMQGLYLVQTYHLTNITTSGPPFLPGEYSFAVKKGNTELLTRLNLGLQIIKNTGEYAQIQEQWLGVLKPTGPTSNEILRYTAYILIPLIFITTGIIAWLYTLKKQVAHKTAELQQEIVERRHVEDALRQSEYRFRSLIEAAPSVILCLSPEGNILEFNPEAEKIFGLSRNDALNKNYFDHFLPEPVRQQVKEEAARILNGYSTRGYENPVQSINGTQYILSWNSDPWSGPDNTPIGIIAIGQDITQKIQLEAQYQQAQKMEALGRLTGGIAHDFNNLLTAINGFAELLARQLPDNTPQKEMAIKIIDSGRHAAELTQQLLAFSRKQPVNPETLNLNTIITDLDKLLPRVIGDNIQLTTNLSHNLYPSKVDPAQLKQVILNLVVNSRDAMPNGGVLTIETFNTTLSSPLSVNGSFLVPGDYAQIIIRDTGDGMSDEVKNHLFEPFFTTKDKGKGTGLGLATVYGIVRQNNGAIQVYSHFGFGTMFSIYFPRINPAATVKDSGKADTLLPTGTETILLVEDDPRVRTLASSMLTQLGYTILEAQNGLQALELAQTNQQSIHLLLSDMIMPHLNGQELAAQLKSIRPTIHVLLMSGDADTILATTTTAKTRFLQKPFTLADIAGKVREALDTKKD